jgi:hypothetical protein
MIADLRAATADETAAALSFALRYRGRKQVFDADDLMAQITAERLVQHLVRFDCQQLRRRPRQPIGLRHHQGAESLGPPQPRTGAG